MTETGAGLTCGRRDSTASRSTVPPGRGPVIGSAVSVDRPGPPAASLSADGAAHHPGGQAVTLPPGGQGSGAGADTPPDGPHPTPTTPEPSTDPAPPTVAGGRPVLVLRVPADHRAPVRLVQLAASAVTFSDAIGGGYLDEALDGVVDECPYVVVLDEHRVAKGLRANQRAAVLAARLGHVNRAWLADLRGDALIVGCGRGGADTDVPDGVIDAAARSGLLPGHDHPDGVRTR
jgi:hypothetical protein